MELAEQYAMRALLRHYWRKGMDAEGAVREICAVEGDNAVETQMARHWFELFEAGHLSLEERKSM